MRKVKLFYLLATIFTIGLFSSCSDDGDAIEVYYNVGGNADLRYERITTLHTQIGGFQLRVKGGSGEYTAYSEDPSILNFYSSHREEYSELTGLDFSTYKVGTTKVTIEDNDNNSTTVTIIVSEKSRPMYIEEVAVVVEGADEATTKVIEADVLETQELNDNSVIDMVFDTKKSGTLTVLPNKKNKDVKYDGTFHIDNPNSPRSIYTLEFNNEVYTYEVSYWEYEKSTKDLGPVPLVWTENLTKTYKAKYPDLSFNKVQYKMYIYASWH